MALAAWTAGVAGADAVSSSPAPAPSPASAPSAAMTVRLADVDYLHRWSHGGMHEFTPAAETDLDAWNDMVTVIVHDQVRDAGQLQRLADAILASWRRGGVVVRTASIPTTPGQPDELFVAAMLVGPRAIEVTFARMRMVGDVGESVQYAHRVYAPQPGAADARQQMAQAAGAWLRAHGADSERALRGWQDVPGFDALRALPQSASN